MITTSMKLASVQPGCRYRRYNGHHILPRTEGEVALCENLRENIAGRLDAVAEPRLLTTLSHRVVAIDTRGEQRWLFGMSDDKVLRLVGVCDADDDFTSLDVVLCTMSQGVKGYASTGAFLVLMLDDGSLFYLLWDYPTLSYSVLGGLPELPTIGVEVGAETIFDNPVEALSFKNSVADMRAGVPSEVKEQVADRLLAEWQSALKSIHAAGMWVQPVQVRFAYRLWDGRLLHITDPTTVGVGYQGHGRIEMPLIGDADGFSGTSAATLSLKGYRISLSLPTWNSSAWNDVISSVEVWISREQQVVDTSRQTAMSQVQTSSGYALSVLLPTLSADDLSAELPDAPIGRHLACDDYDDMPILLNYSSKTRFLTDPPKAEALLGKARLLHGRGDFLHLVSDNNVVTMRRSNPLAVASQTLGVGGEIFAISSQCIGGGAYTRQFVYLFTDHGIVALTHKPDGTHTNCRIISPAVVNSDRLIVATSSGVYALSRTGELLLLRDAKALTIMAGIADCRQLAWDNRSNELWLIPDISDDETASWQRSIVLQIAKEYRAFLSTIVPEETLSNEGCFIFCRQENGLNRLYDLCPMPRQPLMPCRWISAPLSTTDKSPLTEVIVGIEGETTDCSVELHQASILDDLTNDSHKSQMLLKADVVGKAATPLHLRVLPVTMKIHNLTPDRYYRVSLTGKFSTLTGLRLL